jgi:hypothetical protein
MPATGPGGSPLAAIGRVEPAGPSGPVGLVDPVDVPRDRVPRSELPDHEPGHAGREYPPLATLHDLHGLSWPMISRLTGISQSTAHRRAQPYLATEDPEGT